MAVAQVRGRVFDQQPPPKRLLSLLDMAAEEIEALLGIGKRQQVVQISPGNRAPRQVLGDQHRLDALDQRLEAAEMTAIELRGAAQGQSDAVKADWVVTPEIEKAVQGHLLGHVILGMHLEEAKLGPDRRDLRYMRRAQANTRAAARRRSMRSHDRDSAGWIGQLLLRLPPSILAQVPAGT